jgi:hypothetical protein
MKLRLFVVAVLLCSCSLLAQTFRGSIQGSVTDATGAAIPDAQVVVSNSEIGVKRTVDTDANGNFTVTELPLGKYIVTSSKTGFRTELMRNVEVTLGVITRANLTLSPGQVKETVDVSADVPLIDTSNVTTGDTIEGEQAASLPVNGRDFTKLLVLVPGATGDPSGAADSPGSFGLFSINGNRGRSNNYLLDGTDMNDGYRNLPAINEGGVFGTPATVLPIDALAEIPVISNTEPEYGRNSGAIVNLVTRSGTNTLHGSLFEYFRNSGLDARNYFNSNGQPKDTFHNNQFGGSLGGAFIKDRLFYFASYEGQRESGGIPTPLNVPTQDAINSYVAGGGVINPVIQKLLALNPWGPLPQSNGSVVESNPFTNRVDSVIGKIDYHVNASDLLTGRYYFGDSHQSFPLALVGGGVTPGYNTTTPTRVQIVSLSYTKVLNNKLLTEIRGGWNRFAEQFAAQDSSFNPATIGLASLSPSALPRDFGLPLITFSDGTSSIGANASVPRGRIDTNTQLFNNWSYTSGKHAWKFGAEFRRTFVNQYFDASYRSKISFATFDDFLAGTPAGGRSATGNSQRDTFENNYALYAQDTFRLTQRLTLNYGLRWDYFGVIAARLNQFSILSPDGSQLLYVGTGGNAPNKLYPSDYNNFGPRASIAWDVTGKGGTVVHAGWGLFYDAFSQDFFAGQLPYNTFNPGAAYNNIQFSYSPATTIQPGVPVFDPASFAASDVFTVSRKLRTPYIQNYNLGLEQELTKNVALDVGYVGSQGRKLFRFIDLNQVNPATGTRAYPNLGYVNELQTSASSSYNSLQASLKLRAFHGLTSTANFTWGHSIDNASDGQDFVPNASQPDNSFNPGTERANSNFDIRKSFRWYWSYELPNSNFAPWLTNHWSVNGVVTLNDGQPYNVSYLFEGDYNGTGEFFGRPDLVGNPFTGTSTPYQYLNLSAFAVPCTVDASGNCLPGTQHIGNIGRNAFTGPSYRVFDFSVARSFKLGENKELKLQSDFFNVLNHPNFTNPMLPLYGIDFLSNGMSSTGTGKGFLPLTATPDVGIGNPFLGGGGSRNIQLSARFSF